MSWLCGDYTGLCVWQNLIEMYTYIHTSWLCGSYIGLCIWWNLLELYTHTHVLIVWWFTSLCVWWSLIELCVHMHVMILGWFYRSVYMVKPHGTLHTQIQFMELCTHTHRWIVNSQIAVVWIIILQCVRCSYWERSGLEYSGGVVFLNLKSLKSHNS